jgi:hypothetical protein
MATGRGLAEDRLIAAGLDDQEAQGEQLSGVWASW